VLAMSTIDCNLAAHIAPGLTIQPQSSSAVSIRIHPWVQICLQLLPTAALQPEVRANSSRTQEQAMNNLYTRRGFVALGSGAMLGALANRSSHGQAPAAAAPAQPPASAPVNDKPPALDPKDVQRFVGVAHRDIGAVRSMLDQQPTLINA
jgi:hypothetical protein